MFNLSSRGACDSIFCRAFTPEWWGWLIATGVFMACAWGSKVNGILTVFAIGIAVLVDLWDLLDIRKSPSMVRELYPPRAPN